MKKAAWLAAALIVVALALAAIVHSPPVRRYALNRAIATLQEEYGVRLQAEALTYNLFALRVSLRNVRVSAAHSPDAPFLSATSIALAFPRSVIGGPFAIDSIAIEEGRVNVVAARDGTNLPAAKGGGGEELDELPLGSLAAPRLSVKVADTESGSQITLERIDVHVSRSEGRIELSRGAGSISRGSVTTTLAELAGGVTFDGRRLHLSKLALRTGELAATVDGDVALLVRDPRLDLRVSGKGDVARLASFVASVREVPRGTIEFDGEVTGPFASPGARLNVKSPALAWGPAEPNDIAATVRIDANRFDVDRFETRIAGGQVTANGTLAFGGAESSATLAWNDIDLETLAVLAGADVAPRPSGRTNGSIAAHGAGTDLAGWVADGSVDVRGGITSRNRVAIAGRVVLDVDRGRWSIGTPRPIAVAGLPVRATLGGRLNFDSVERSTVRGLVELNETPVTQVIDVLHRTGTATIETAPVDGSIRAQATIAGSLGQPQVEVKGGFQVADVAALAPGTPVRGPVVATIESDLRTARITAGLRDLNVTAEGSVGLRAPHVAKVLVHASNLPLQRALEGMDTGVAIEGTLTATAQVIGPLDRWRELDADVDLENLDARAGALAIRLASPARISLRGEVADVPALDLLAGETRVSAAGRLPLTEHAADVADAEALTITATGDLAQFLNAVAATGLVTLPDVSGTGPAVVLARVTGSAERPRVAGNLELGPGSVSALDLPPVTNVMLRGHADGHWIELRDLQAEWQGSTVSVQGRAPLAWTGIDTGSSSPGNGTLTARLTSVTPRVLEPFVDAATLEQIAGSVDVSLQAESPSLELERATGELRLDRMELRMADLPIAQREPTRIAIRDGFAEIRAWEWKGQGGNAGVRGRVRLADRQAALLADGQFDLRMITPFTRDLGLTVAGRIEPRLSITGPIDSPRVDGIASLSDSEIRLTDPRVVATDVDGRIVLTRSRAQLTALTGRVNGGALTGAGSVEFAPGDPIAATLQARIEGMALEFPEGLHSELDADVGVSIDIPPGDAMVPSGRVGGTVTIVRGAYREPIGVATGLLSALRTRRIASEVGTAERSLADNITLDVRVTTEEELIVDNNIGRLGLGADLRVIGTAASPILAGRAQLTPGGEIFLARNRYEIDSGTIDFANPVAIEPLLTITATTRAGGHEIELTITGTSEAPQLEARSLTSPDLTQAEVVSLLLTGRLLEEIGGDEAEFVTEQALAYLSGDVLAFASRAVGLDTIRFGSLEESRSGDTSVIATEVDPTSRLTFGKSIGRNVDVAFSQGLRDGDAQTWIVDYRPRRQVETRLVSNDENLRSYEFRHDVSFGGASLSDARATPRTPRPEQRVASVTVTGSELIPEQQLRRELELQADDRFEFGEWQRDRDRLLDVLHRAGLCEARITARITGEDAVALSYAITDGPRCAIEVNGHTLSPDTHAALRRAWSEAVFDDFLVQEAQTMVHRALAGEGYVQPKVDVSLAAAGDRKTMLIRVEPGANAVSRRVRFEGVEGALAAELQEWAAAGAAGEGATEDPPAFERAVTAWLHARGYVRARVTLGAPHIDGGDAVVPVTIDAGIVATLADVRVQGVNAAQLRAVLDTADLAGGAPFDPTVVDAARDRIRARYRREGFSEATVDLRTAVNDKTGAVTVTFLVAEGPRQVLREVAVAGNRAIDTDVIVRALELEENEPLRIEDWLQARRRVFETGLFRRVDVTPEAIGTAVDGVQPMRARVVVQEWPALRLRYGFQVAEERPEGEVRGRDLVPGLSADITRRTLFGRAVTVGAALDYQRRERSGRGFIRSRTMLGLPIESSFVFERSHEEFAADTLVTDMNVASWEQRLRRGRHLRFSYAYVFKRDHTFDTGPPDPIVGPIDFLITTAWLNVATAFDTRDDPADTTRGWLLSSSFDWAPARLGGDFRFVKHLGQAYYFQPWRRLVFASAARVGIAAPLGGQDLAPSERYFAGGARTVRAVDEDTLGPVDFGGSPSGGESLLVLNHEVRFPLYRWLRGVGFVDAGNVFEDAGGIRPGDLVGAYGVGLRLATPFALFRVDYGRLFSPRPGTSPARWTFGIGQAF